MKSPLGGLEPAGMPGGRQRGGWRSWPVLPLALSLAMAGCGFGRTPVSTFSTPSDPPPVPPPKPGASSRSLDQITERLTGQATKPKVAQAASVPAVQGTKLQVQAPALRPGQSMHLVTRGQSVYSVARLYGVTVRAVIAANRLAPPYKLAVGQQLVVPEKRIHVVRSGDTVYGISRRYGADLKEFMSINGIGSTYRILPGQRLVVPTVSGTGTLIANMQASGGAKLKSAAVSAAPSAEAAAQAAALPAATIAVVPEPEVSGPIPKPAPRSSDKFLWPVSGKLVLNYGPKKGGLHNDGINIAAPRGTPVVAAENGVVAYAGNELRGFGNLLLIKHQGGWMTAYAHNDSILVGRGAKVRRGQTVARVGNSGNVVSPQLHFEIRKGTRAVNPSKLLGPSQSAQKM